MSRFAQPFQKPEGTTVFFVLGALSAVSVAVGIGQRFYGWVRHEVTR